MIHFLHRAIPTGKKGMSTHSPLQRVKIKYLKERQWPLDGGAVIFQISDPLGQASS